MPTAVPNSRPAAPGEDRPCDHEVADDEQRHERHVGERVEVLAEVARLVGEGSEPVDREDRETVTSTTP